MLLSSNLPFSGWEAIFKDAMTTAAAIDRLVHHSVIVELNVSSYRAEQAKKAKQGRPTEGGGTSPDSAARPAADRRKQGGPTDGGELPPSAPVKL